MIFHVMRDATASLLEHIHAHPFNRELAQGTLPSPTFIHYLQQDALYLGEFARALSITAARLPSQEHARQFMRFSLDAIQAEQQLHATFLSDALIDPASDIAPSPACFMYTHYLLKTVSLDTVEEAVACLLPCFWIYHEVGKQIAHHQHPAHPYQRWIALYASEAFESSVKAALNIMNELAEQTSPVIYQKMITAFVRSTELEWLFWDSAYRQETWKTGASHYVLRTNAGGDCAIVT